MARRVLATILAGLLLVALAIAAFVVIGRARIAREKREIAALKEKLARGGGDAVEHHRLGLHLAAERDAANALAHLEMAVEGSPQDLRFGNDLRLSCARLGEYDRSIRFFERLAADNPAVPGPRVQLALAYVDKMPDHMMGIVGQSKLSNLSIRSLEKALEREAEIRDPDTRWAALYALALNHLYWPKALKHAPAAAEAFRRCLAFQERLGDDRAAPNFVLPRIGLGDALVKDGRHAEAREVWRQALELFPGEARLVERLAIESDQDITRYIDKVRGLGLGIDTDLAILWGRTP